MHPPTSVGEPTGVRVTGAAGQKRPAAADEDLACALEEMAVGARGRSGYAAATAALEWAASLSADDAGRARRLYAGACDAALAGQHSRAQALKAAADRVAAASDRPRTVPALHSAAAAALDGDPMAAINAARQAEQTAAASTEPAALASLVRGLALLQMGRVRDGITLLRTGLRIPRRAGIHGSTLELRIVTGHALSLTGEQRAAMDELSAVVEDVRRAGAMRLLPAALCGYARAAAVIGRLAAAVSAGTEAVALARLMEDFFWHQRGLSLLTFVHAIRGDEALCRSTAAQALALGKGQAAELDDAVAHCDLSEALRLLELGLGRYRDAVAAREARRWTPGAGDSEDLVTLPLDALEAQVRSGGRLPSRVVRAVERISHDLDFPVRAARAWRLRGLMAAPSESGSCFMRALELHRTTEQPFEQGRTLLAFGERLRRAGQRGDAREYLRRAFDLFEQLGARPWAERASIEVAATGQHLAQYPVVAGDVEALTAQELQVARAVAIGLTNREVAATLFLSHKTVEFHLGNVYRKLGVRGRTQLAHRFPAIVRT